MIYSRVLENKEKTLIGDAREEKGLIDFIQIKNEDLELKESYINLVYQKNYTSYENRSMVIFEKLPLQIKDRMTKISDKDLLVETRGKYAGMLSYLKRYDETLRNIWKEFPYEKSIFIIIPYRNNIVYKEITRGIKEAVNFHGFNAFLVDTKNVLRKELLPTVIWGNLVVIFTCQYLILWSI